MASEEDFKVASADVKRIKGRLRSRPGYCREIEGVNTFDIPQMSDDMRTLIKAFELVAAIRAGKE